MPQAPTLIRFGPFEVDRASGELRKQGVRIKVHDQSFQVLLALLEQPSQVVTRQELQGRLWPADTFVEFENGLNNAISRLREALGDSADAPRYIETLPRRGYRFVAPVSHAAVAGTVQPDVAASRAKSRRWPLAIGVAAALALLVSGYLGVRPRAETLDSVAVLPLTRATLSAGTNAGDEYFADAMTEALITELSRIGALKVISQTSSSRYKDSGKPLPQIARELGVKAVVEGSVSREGNQVRITVQLIEASTDKHLWADSYQREMRNILALQSEVAQAIAREVRVKLTPQEQAALAAARPVNPKAHEAYLKGRYILVNDSTQKDWGRAEQYFREALQADPQYAPAFAGLSTYYAANIALHPLDAMAKAKGYAQKALSLDDRLSESHLAMSQVHHFGWDLAAAEREARRALELDPGSVTARVNLGQILYSSRRFDEVVQQYERILNSDPLTVRNYMGLALAYAYNQQFDRAFQSIQSAQELDPNAMGISYVLGNIYWAQGKCAEANREIQKEIEKTGRHPFLLHILAYNYAVCGERQKVPPLLRELKQMATKQSVPATWFGLIHLAMNEGKSGFEFLEKAYREREPDLILLNNPIYDALRSDARYQDLLRRMNFPQ